MASDRKPKAPLNIPIRFSDGDDLSEALAEAPEIELIDDPGDPSDEGQMAGEARAGETGLGGPEVDLAAGVWTLQYNFGKGFARAFLEVYGWPPMTDQAIEKLRRRYAR